MKARLGDRTEEAFETMRRTEAQASALWRESFLSRWAAGISARMESRPPGGEEVFDRCHFLLPKARAGLV